MTAVEFLEERRECDYITWEDIQQAKEMEKQQIEDTSEQIQILNDDAELNNKIIATQEELIQLQYQAIEARNKYIAVLESQLKIQDTYLSK